MDKKTAQKLIHQYWHDTQAVPWIDEHATQQAFPLSAALMQFLLSEGTDKETINTLCYNLTALLGEVAKKLRHVDLKTHGQSKVKTVLEKAVYVLDFEYIDQQAADTFSVALLEHLTDWENDGPSALAGRFGEALALVAQTLNCVNNHEGWNPKPSLLEACRQAVEDSDSDWQPKVMRAIEDGTWGKALCDHAKAVLDPEQRPTWWEAFETTVRLSLREKCGQCYKPGSVRYSCGAYAGRYCDEHWETSGYRPASDRVDFLDAGEHATEEEAY